MSSIEMKERTTEFNFSVRVCGRMKIHRISLFSSHNHNHNASATIVKRKLSIECFKCCRDKLQFSAESNRSEFGLATKIGEMN